MALTFSLNSSTRGWNCHDKLVELADIQAKRVLALFAQERQSGSILVKLNTLIKDYANLLAKIQELRFDLGLDEFRRGQLLPTEIERRIQEEAERRFQQNLREQIERVEEVFDKLNIPTHIEDHGYAHNSWSTKQTDARAPEEKYVQQR